MTPVRSPLLLALIVVLSGCTGRDAVVLEEPSLTLLSQDPTTGEDLFLKPNLTVGRWWDTRLAIDYDDGFLLDLEGKVVVSKDAGDGFRLGADNTDFGTLDEYFDSFYHGGLDDDLNPLIGETRVKLFQWPLKEGLTWTTELPAQGFDGFIGRVDPIQMNVTTFEEDTSPYAPRLRVQGATAFGETLDFDYSASTGWMTYFRMINQTTGRVIVSLDFRATGVGFVGDVHHLDSQDLYEGFRMTPPFDPAFAPVPPLERVEVPAGFLFVDEIKFLFTYPLGTDEVAFGGGQVAVVITLPNATVHPTYHTGAGDLFQGKFERRVASGATAGTWTVSILPGGTGGAFVGLYGFKDDVVTL